MRLSDVIGGSDLAVFAEIALVFFACAFGGVLIYTFTRRNRETFARARQIPLDDARLVDEQPQVAGPTVDASAGSRRIRR